MIDYPCSNRCPTYAMCIQRNSVERYEICSIFSDYIIGAIEHSQSEMDKKHGKGNLTVAGMRVESKGVLIDKKGNLIAGVKNKKERTHV